MSSVPDEPALAEEALAIAAMRERLPAAALEAALTHLPVAIFGIDAGGRLLFAHGSNAAQMGLFGESVGQEYGVVFAENPSFCHRLADVLASFQGREMTWLADLRGYTWRIRALALPASADGLLLVAQNITDRLNAETEARWRSREVSALNAITTAVSSTLEFDEVLETLRVQLAAQLGILGGAVFLLDFVTFVPALHSCWGINAERMQERVPTVLEMLAPGHPLAPGALEFPPAPGTDDGGGDELASWRYAFRVPLLAADQVLGLLLLFSHDGLVFYKPGANFFEMLGRQVGAALQNARLFREVREGRERQQELNRRLVAAQDAERARIARELHDEFGQILTCLRITLDLSERTEEGSPEQAQAHRREARTLVAELLQKVRRLSVELRTSVVDDLGLHPALGWHTERFTAQTGIQISLDHDGIREMRFPKAVEEAAYRIVQEALTNVARYAEAPAASVSLHCNDRTLRIVIEDAGVGFSVSDVTGYGSALRARLSGGGTGLSGMRERAEALGGTLSITSHLGHGTRIVALLPFQGESPTG